MYKTIQWSEKINSSRAMLSFEDTIFFSDVHNIQIYCWKILLYHSLILWRLTASLTMTSTTMMSTTMLTGGSCVWHIWWWWTNSILVVEIWKKFMLNNKSSSSTDILWWWWFWFFLAVLLVWERGVEDISEKISDSLGTMMNSAFIINWYSEKWMNFNLTLSER